MSRFQRCLLTVVVALGLFGATLPAEALSSSAAGSSIPKAHASRDYDCSDFATQRQAQRFFRRHNPRRDPHRLDADRDGIACESLP